MKLADISAVVTGGASGLGAATAVALAAGGAHVVAIDLPSAVAAAAPTAGITLIAADVTREEQVRAAVAMASALAPLKVAVNCAGIGIAARIVPRFGGHDFAEFSRVINVNLVGTFMVLAIAAEAMSQTDPDVHGQRGVIVNTASVSAYDGQIGQAAYASSKAAVVGLTLPAARDLAQHGIRVNTIAPGIVDTPMLAMVGDEIRAGLAAGVPFPKRLCEPREFAQLVTMIIDHDYLNGETIRMDGALRMAPTMSGTPIAIAVDEPALRATS